MNNLSADLNLFSLTYLKHELLSLLHQNGIPEMDIQLKTYKNNSNQYLGAYKTRSQFRNRAIILIDIKCHQDTLLDNDNYQLSHLHNALLDTLAHEYGHVIEEFIMVDADRKKEFTLFNHIKNHFDDMEDFAESFSFFIQNKDSLDSFQYTIMKDIIDYYCQEIFTEESVTWAKQERWKRELDLFTDKNKNKLAKLNTMKGSFNQCSHTCHWAAAALSEQSYMDVKILKVSQYKKELLNAHPEWIDIGKDFVIHYLLLLDNKMVIDFTAKQFGDEKPSTSIYSIEELEKEWIDIDIYKDTTKTNHIKETANSKRNQL